MAKARKSVRKPSSPKKTVSRKKAAPSRKPAPRAGKTLPGAPDANLLADLMKWATAAGADAADAAYGNNESISVAQRLGKREKLESSEGRGLRLRAFIGQRQATVSTTDFAPKALRELAERVVSMARAVPEDPYCGIAPKELLATQWPDLDLDDKRQPPSAKKLLELAGEAEEAALSVQGVTNSEGAQAGWERTTYMMATSNGFSGGYRSGSYQLYCSVLAGEGTAMERDGEWSAAIYFDDLMAAKKLGRTAGKYAVERLNPKKAPNDRLPVVYDRRVSGGMLGHLAGAINGRAVARGTSFLKDKMGQRIFAKGIRIVDNPHRKRGLGSRPFDGDGLPTKRWSVIDDGVLTTWLLDLTSARQLDLKPTGHGGSTSNFYLEKGALSPDELIADIKSGLYITDLIGHGVNAVTGDYSRGASGFWIENGQKAWPVSGLTVAGNLKDMFLNMTPANDLQWKSATNAPTLRIEGMTIAGS